MNDQPNALTRKVFLAEAAAVNEHIDATRQPAAPDDLDLREGIRRVLCDYDGKGYLWGTDMLEPDEYGGVADAVLAVRGRDLERLKAEVAAARKFAEEMRGYCSPHGVSADYADRLLEAMDRAKEGR